MHFLKQSTASQAVLLGPFVDSTDGDTEETGLTIANTDIRLSKNGGNLAAKASGGGTHDEAGWYTVTFDATDSDTVGRLKVFCHVSGALMVERDYTVLEEAVYDALFGASAPGYLQPTTAARTLDVTAAGTAGIDWGNIENKGTANQLSATDINNVDDINLNIAQAAGVNLIETTTATVASQTSFTLTNGSADDDAYNGAMAVFTDSGTQYTRSIGRISDYTGSTKTVTLAADPGVFTLAAGDLIAIVPVPPQILTHVPQTADHTAGIADIPTNAELNLRTLPTASYFDASAETVTLGTNGVPADGITTDAITAAAISSGAGDEIAAALLDLGNGVETSVTVRQALRVGLAADAGKVDGAATTTMHLRNQADDKNRVTATVDANGNRTAITLDLT